MPLLDSFDFDLSSSLLEDPLLLMVTLVSLAGGFELWAGGFTIIGALLPDVGTCFSVVSRMVVVEFV